MSCHSPLESSPKCTNSAYIRHGSAGKNHGYSTEAAARAAYRCPGQWKRGVAKCCADTQGFSGEDGYYYFCEKMSGGHTEYSSYE